jgi:putative ABC transport system permease protein
MNKMIISNLVHRPIRSLISIFAVALEVTLILVLVGICFGILNDSKARQQGIGGDVMVRPPGSSNLIGLSSAGMPIKVANILAKLPHMKALTPVLIQASSAGTLENIYGIDVHTYPLGTPFHYLSGGPFQGPNDIIVDDFYADSAHKKTGDTVDVLNHTFRISGVVEHGAGGRKFVPITTLQDLIGAQGKTTMFYVKLDDPKNYPPFRDAVLKTPGMEQYNVVSMQEYLSLITPERLPGFSIAINVIIGVGVCIGFIVIFQSMYTAVMERTREIGILKSLGASKTYIVNVVLRETVVLAIVGVLLGIVISLITGFALRSRFRTLTVDIENRWILQATVIALVGAIIGALYPAFKAAQKDPIDALAYE